MTKKKIIDTTLLCMLQDDSILDENSCLTGVLTSVPEGFRFEEEAKVKPKPHTRNPKIFNGEYISLVRKTNNSVQFSFKSTKCVDNPDVFALDVYLEITQALNMICDE